MSTLRICLLGDFRLVYNDIPITEFNQVTDSGGLRQPPWWHEWIRIHFETYTVYYWLGQIQTGIELLQQIEPVVAQSVQQISKHNSFNTGRPLHFGGIVTLFQMKSEKISDTGSHLSKQNRVK